VTPWPEHRPAKGPGKGPPSGIPAKGPGHGGAASPYSPGNVRGLRVGHRSARVYGELAHELVAGLLADRPDLAAWPEAVGGWATAEACAALLRRHLDEVGVVDPEKREPPGASLDALRRYEKQAAEHRAVLGLDPRSEASLMRERATAATLVVDLEALAERGRAILADRPDVGAPNLAGQVLSRVRALAESADPSDPSDSADPS